MVWAPLTLGILIVATDAGVHRIDARCFAGQCFVAGKGGGGKPADGAGEATERVAAVARVAANACQATGVECLHQQCADAAYQSAEVGMDDPWGFIGKVESATAAGGDLVEPRRVAIGAATEQAAESAGEVILDWVVGHGSAGRMDVPASDRNLEIQVMDFGAVRVGHGWVAAGGFRVLGNALDR